MCAASEVPVRGRIPISLREAEHNLSSRGFVACGDTSEQWVRKNLPVGSEQRKTLIDDVPITAKRPNSPVPPKLAKQRFCTNAGRSAPVDVHLLEMPQRNVAHAKQTRTAGIAFSHHREPRLGIGTAPAIRRCGTVENVAVDVIALQVFQRTGQRLRNLCRKIGRGIVRQPMILTGLVRELRLQENICARDSAPPVRGCECLTDSDLCVMSPLIGGVDPTETHAQQRARQDGRCDLPSTQCRRRKSGTRIEARVCMLEDAISTRFRILPPLERRLIGAHRMATTTFSLTLIDRTFPPGRRSIKRIAGKKAPLSSSQGAPGLENRFGKAARSLNCAFWHGSQNRRDINMSESTVSTSVSKLPVKRRMTPHNRSYNSRALIRLLAWAKRYGASELVGTFTAYVGYFTALGMTQNHVAAAYGGSIGESLGFFGVMVIREIAADRAKAKRRLGCYGPKEISATIRGLFLEFGPAELLDTGLIGPLAMGTASYYLGPWIGILVGKLASDTLFMDMPSLRARCAKSGFARRPKIRSARNSPTKNRRG